MDRVKFNKIADTIAKAYGTNRKKIFERSKRPDIVHPRQLLWHVCTEIGMRPSSIELFTKENGLEMNHSTIIRGIRSGERLTHNNEKLSNLADSLASSEF